MHYLLLVAFLYCFNPCLQITDRDPMQRSSGSETCDADSHICECNLFLFVGSRVFRYGVGRTEGLDEAALHFLGKILDTQSAWYLHTLTMWNLRGTR